LFTTARKAIVLTHAIVEGAKALGGSFKLVTLAPADSCTPDAFLRQMPKSQLQENEN